MSTCSFVDYHIVIDIQTNAPGIRNEKGSADIFVNSNGTNCLAYGRLVRLLNECEVLIEIDLYLYDFMCVCVCVRVCVCVMCVCVYVCVCLCVFW